jgi:hypothetical protein
MLAAELLQGSAGIRRIHAVSDVIVRKNEAIRGGAGVP